MTDAVCFFDATCKKCGRRYGWHGRLADKPACPSCKQKAGGPLPKAPTNPPPSWELTCGTCRHCGQVRSNQHRCRLGGFTVKVTTRACGDFEKKR